MHTQPRFDYASALVAMGIDAERAVQGLIGSDSATGLFLALPTPRLPQGGRTARAGAVASTVLHAALVTILMLVGTRSLLTPSSTASNSQSVPQTPTPLPRMVFLAEAGPGGGGGGGGGRQAAPPSRARAIGRDRLTLPVTKPIVASLEPIDVAPPPQQVVLDAVPLASSIDFQAGLPEAPPSLGFSQGPGVGGGIGEGIGTGIGSGTGPGMGPGSGGGFGGGVYRLGSGVVAPTVLTQVTPTYTPEALQRKIQGAILLDVVVRRDGVPGAIRVTRSLDPGGLDRKAIEAIREWRFNPGRIGDTPVDVMVTIILDFSIR